MKKTPPEEKAPRMLAPTRTDFASANVAFVGANVDFTGGNVEFAAAKVDSAGAKVDFAGAAGVAGAVNMHREAVAETT